MQNPARTDTRKLDGQVALVTGAAQGIGLCIAQRLADQGAQLVLVDIDEALVTNAAAALKASPAALGLKADVSNPGECEAIVQTAVERFQKVDILVNNAGVTRDNLVMRMSEADWDTVMDINLKGAFNFTKAVARGMLKAHHGRIINIASIVGQQGNAGQANYAASKGGLIALTKACAREFASRQVLVNAVAPGFIRTRMTQALSPQAQEKLLSHILLGRMGEPEDVAGCVLFLAGPDASYITGHIISVNGGMYM